jgi:large repetitive protein
MDSKCRPGACNFHPNSTLSGSFNATLTVSGSGTCAGNNPTSTRTVRWGQTPTVDAGADITICTATPLNPISMAGATAGGTYSAVAWSGGGGLGAWTQNANPALATFTPSTPSGSFTATLTVTGSAGCTGTNPSDTRIITWGQTPTVDAGANISFCTTTPLAPIPMTGATAGGTFSAATWSGGAALGTWTQNANPALATFTPTSNSGSFTATLTLTGSAGCAGNNPSDTRTIEWDQTPTGAISASPNVICAGGSSTLTFTLTGNGPFNVTYNDGGAPINLNGINNGHTVVVSPAVNTTYTLTFFESAGGPLSCPGTITTATALVEVGSIPTSATLTGSGDACQGVAASFIRSVITSGAPPYELIYTINGGAPQVVPNYTSGANINLGVLPVGTYNFVLVSVEDDCGNFVPPGGLPGTYTIVINANPNADATVNNTPNLCHDGTTDIDLQSTIPNTIFNWTVSVVPAVAWLPAKAPVNGSLVGNASVITQQLAHSGASPVTVTYTITPTGPGVTACPGPQITRSVVVNPLPTLTSSLTPGPICSNSAFSYTPTSNSAVTFDWDRATVAGITPAGPTSGTGNPNETLRNLTAAPINVTYEYTLTINGCTNTQNVVVSVRPEPILADLAATICSDEASGLNLSVAVGSVAAATYNITAINPNGLTASAGAPAVGNGFAANVIANDAWTNTTNANVDVVYTVVPVSAAGCAGDPKLVTLTIRPEPVLANLAVTVCSDEPSGLNLSVAAGSVAAATYNITVITPNGLSASAGAPAVGTGFAANVIADDAWTNTTSANVNVVYTVVPVSANGCLGNPRDVTVTIRPEPVLANLSTTVCSDSPSGLNLSVAAGSVAAATYNITAINPNGLTASAGAPAVGTGFAANVISNDAWTNTSAANVNVVYTVVPVSANGCLGEPRDVTITVRPEPILADLAATICSDEASGLNLSVAVGSVAAATYNITAINPNGLTASAGAPAVGNGFAANVIANDAWTNTTNANVDVVYTVVPVSAAGCAGDPKLVTLTIRPEPVLANLAVTVCSDEPSGLNLSVAAGSVAAATYNITVITPNGLTASAGAPAVGTGFAANVIADDAWTNTTLANVNVVYTVVPVSANGCLGNPRDVTVTIRPEPILANLSTTVCSDSPSGLNLSVAAGSVAAATYNITAINPNGLTASAGAPAVGTGFAANVIANDAWTNTTSATVSVIYTVVPVSAAGCLGNPRDVTVLVNPEPVIANQTVDVCSGEALDHQILLDNFVNPADNVQFTWPAPVLDPGLTGGSARAVASSANMTDLFTNLTGLALEATYTVTPYYNGCPGNPRDIVVTIGSEPVLDPNLDKEACSNQDIELELREDVGSVVATGYNITAVSYSAGINFAGGNPVPQNAVDANYLFNNRYSNLTGTPGTVTFTVVPYFGASCIGAPVDVVITINPQPVVAPQNETICSNNSPGLTITSNVAGASFAWEVVGITGSVSGTAIGNTGTGNTFTEVITNDDNFNPATVTYEVVGTGPAGLGSCVGAPVLFVITINPVPNTSLISGNDPVCEGAVNEIYSVDFTPGSTYAWTFAGDGTKTFGGNPSDAFIVFNFPISGNQNITVQETNLYNCIGPVRSFDVAIQPKPAAVAITGPVAVCAGETGVIYDVPLTANSEYFWLVPAGAFVTSGATPPDNNQIEVTFASTSGKVRVRETNEFGCVGPMNELDVVVNPNPVLFNVTGGGEYCEGGAGIAVGLSGSQAGVDYELYLDGNPTGNVVPGTGAVISFGNQILPGSYTVFATSTTAPTFCAGLMVGSALVIENILPIASADPVNQPAICSGENIQTIVLDVTNGIPGTTFTWSRDFLAEVQGLENGVGNIAGSLQNITSNQVTVTFTIVPTSGVGCVGASIQAQVTVNPEPIASATNSVQTICSNTAFTDIELSVTNGVAMGSYSWTRNNTVSVTGMPASGTGDVIAGTLRNQSASPVIVTFTIIPESLAGCEGDPITATVTVNPEPIATATPVNQTVCSNSPITNIVFGTTNGVPGTTYSWTRDNTVDVTGIAASGNGNVSGTMRNLTGAPITVTFTITPTSGAGCDGDQITAQVTVNPEPLAVATPDNQTACSNTAIADIILSTSNGLAGTTYSWTRNNTISVTGIDGAGSGNISGTMRNVTGAAVTVTFTITPRSAAGCEGDPITATVIVNPEPIAQALPSNQAVCSNVAMTDIVLSASNGVAGTTFAWTRDNLVSVTGIPDNGSGDITGTPRNFTGAPVTVTFTIIPTSGAGCDGAPITATLVVNPEPLAVATPNSQTKCSGTTMDVIALSTSNGLFGTSYAWTRDNLVDVTGIANSGSGNITGIPENITGAPVTVTFTITPTSGSGCVGDDITAELIVNPEPIASATNSVQTICSNTAFTDIELSVTNGVAMGSYSWTRNNTVSVTGMPASGTGDVIAGTLRNQSASPVIVTFTIIPESLAGCEGDPITATVTVNPEPIATATPVNQTVCSNSPITNIVFGTTNGVPGTTYSWTRDNTVDVTGIAASGNGNVSGTMRNLTGAPITVTFTITPTSGAGCDGDQITAQVTVNPEPLAVATPDNQTACSNTAIADIILSTSNGLAGTTYSWTRNNTISVTGIDGAGSGNISGTMRNVTGAAVTVTFTITPRSAAGCEGDPITATVIVNPEPIAQALPSNQAVCSNVAMTDIVLSASNGVAGTTFAWTRDNLVSVTGIPDNGSGDITGTPRNFTGAPVTVTFTIIPTSGAGCDGAPITATLVVNPEPLAVATPNSQTKCSGTTMDVIALSTSNGLFATSFTWTRDNIVDVTGISNSGSGNISGLPVNTTNIPVLVTFTITPTSGAGCIGENITATLLVEPEPIAEALPVTQTICTGDFITEIVPGTTNGVVGTVFNWTRDNPAVIGTIGLSGSGNINGTLINNSSVPVTVTFTITPRFNLCDGIPTTVEVVVNPIVTIITEPVDVIACEGSDAQFSVVAGFATGYQWQEFSGGTWNDIPGETADILIVPAVNPAMDGNEYRVVVSGCGPDAVSAVVDLTVRIAPVITDDPDDEEVCVGDPVTFDVVAIGNIPEDRTYQWQISTNGGVDYSNLTNTGVYSGTTTATLSIASASNFMDGYLYRAIVSTYCAPPAVSAPAELTTRVAPVINVQPISVTACEGATVDYSVTATGDALTYQWEESTDGGLNYLPIAEAGIYSGTQTAMLTITGVTAPMNGYRYRVVITGQCPPVSNLQQCILNSECSSGCYAGSN